ncbi:DNA-directed RNA polymerases I and III subunit RPAC2-like [Tubulanus polymorphus]|uniref:DNA-directed RNA polymerases I and III subunit RPAC2-like n=1 Tax=Tubulanus polymorphus TaxID=672921 RepID=UPI003DA2DA8B
MTQEKKKTLLEVVESEIPEDETCRTFILHNEDHTLGNSLRYITMKNPEVEFCGYSVPHPSESKINFRIQTKEVPAVEALKQGLTDLGAVCEHVLTVFERSVALYKRQQHVSKMDVDT